MVNESRILQIDLKTAREWYKSDNAALKQLALKVFSEEELKPRVIKEIVDEILSSPEVYRLNEIQKIQLKGVQSRKGENISAIKQLRILSIYYNRGWTKGFTGVGYFISKDSCGWKIIKHNTVSYPGIPYFRKEEYAKKALEILSDDILERLYTDL